MEKRTITITASGFIMNAISLLLLPAGVNPVASQTFYLKTLKETTSVCLS
jgi:hypothetical protein